MMKRLALAAVMSTALACGARAEAPDNPEQCMHSAFELAQAAEQKQLPNDKLDKIEEMLTKMEDHCDAKRFNEAMAVAKDIEAEIGAQ